MLVISLPSPSPSPIPLQPLTSVRWMTLTPRNFPVTTWRSRKGCPHPVNPPPNLYVQGNTTHSLPVNIEKSCCFEQVLVPFYYYWRSSDRFAQITDDIYTMHMCIVTYMYMYHTLKYSKILLGLNQTRVALISGAIYALHWLHFEELNSPESSQRCLERTLVAHLPTYTQRHTRGGHIYTYILTCTL